MHLRLRDLVAIGLAVAALALSFVASASLTIDRGLRLGVDNGQIVVASVEPGSAAAFEGLRPGNLVTDIEMQSVLDLTASQREAIVAALPDRGGWIDFLGVAGDLHGLALPTGASVIAVPDTTFSGPSIASQSLWLGRLDGGRSTSRPVLLFGVAVLLVGVWWLRRQSGTLRVLATTLPVAVAYPLLAVGFEQYPRMPALVASAILLPLSQLPLAIDFAERISSVRPRRGVIAVAAGLGVASCLAYLASPADPSFRAARVLLAGAVSLVPGLFAAIELRATPARDTATDPGGRRIVEWTEVGIAAATPAIALLPLRDPGSVDPLPLALWLALVFGVRTLTLRPLLRLATRATLGRDVALAATEAERARIAADIHDEVLQDVTMLVRRLDAAGDAQNAESAREIATRLRAICGELRLPILDDLGVGPALEWLVSKFQPLVRGEIYLERLQDELRLPSRVELGVFRIAQEALTNAVKHGKAPIVVRYRSGGRWCELDVDDSGAGVPADAAEAAEAAGHFGLLNMTQRAEQIDAALRVGRRPGGGTRVSLVWEAEANEAREPVDSPATLDTVEPEASA